MGILTPYASTSSSTSTSKLESGKPKIYVNSYTGFTTNYVDVLNVSGSGFLTSLNVQPYNVGTATNDIYFSIKVIIDGVELESGFYTYSKANNLSGGGNLFGLFRYNTSLHIQISAGDTDTNKRAMVIVGYTEDI